jgi:hypothetical protein
LLLFLLKHAQKNKTLNKHLTSKLQFSQNFTPDSVADSNDRAKCDVSVFMIFEWTLRCRSIVKKNYKNLRFFYFKVKLFFKNLFFFNFCMDFNLNFKMVVEALVLKLAVRPFIVILEFFSFRFN